ncbi:hypothetical protein BBK36DRAFT_1142106 [Trichoderma citrinoviride]|uniref:Uncharacterized protein n=1 Tax=Trichoderma citrinoviride TaxID=58853 RepID=A0A2T4B6Z8_9HYPO|nr:hypothetical protein BBK36DRAFT_1142106 [Trichoderma citrinoviride]PTB65097.1 hypothetical protein BBK36DRAFT_1142106 [Trichoderma citrinoviride]
MVQFEAVVLQRADGQEAEKPREATIGREKIEWKERTCLNAQEVQLLCMNSVDPTWGVICYEPMSFSAVRMLRFFTELQAWEIFAHSILLKHPTPYASLQHLRIREMAASSTRLWQSTPFFFSVLGRIKTTMCDSTIAFLEELLVDRHAVTR